MGGLQDLTELMRVIDGHEKASLLSLHVFASHKEASHGEFVDLLDKLDFKGGDPFVFL